MSNVGRTTFIAILAIVTVSFGAQDINAEDLPFIISDIHNQDLFGEFYRGHLSDWSSSGRYVLVEDMFSIENSSDEHILLVIDMENDSKTSLHIPYDYNTKNYGIKESKFHLDEKVIYLSIGPVGIFRHDTVTNKVKQVLDKDIGSFDFSADGTRITFSEMVDEDSGKYNLYSSNLDGSDQRLILEDVPWRYALSPDNSKIAFLETTWAQYNTTAKFKIYDFKAKSFEYVPNLTLHCGDVFTFDPTGNFLLYGDIICSKSPPYDAGLFVTSLQGKSELLLDLGEHDLRGMVTSPKGDRIIIEANNPFTEIQFEKYPQNELDFIPEDFSFVLNEGAVVEEDTGEEGGGCLIATAAYGTELSPQVQFLREIRDNTVIGTSSGSSFITGFNQLYYSFSPTIADMVRENPMFKETVKAFITPMVSTLSIMTLADNNSEIDVLGLGISVIVLNLGMYIVAPAAVAWQIKKRI